MSKNYYLTNFENQNNKLQKKSHTFYPKSMNKMKFSYNRKINESIEANHESRNFAKNRNYKKFIPKKMRKYIDWEGIENMKLDLTVKAYSTNIEKFKNQEKEIETEEKEKIINNECIYSYEYLIQFESWEVSNQTELLPKETIEHINELEEQLKEMDKYYPREKFKTSCSNCNTSKSSSSSNISFSMEQWARKDYTKETKAAEENKKRFEEHDQKDVIRRELRSILNIMTKDNYEETKTKILEIIKENVEYQEQFLDIFFLKAVMEKSYAELYAKLCKYLNKELPQKSKKSENSKKVSSIFRDKLVDKCRKILKTKSFDKYIREKDSIERENKLKKFIVGNVNFISELIKVKMLSKKIMPECIEYLLNRYDNDEERELKLIHAQAIVLFSDRFGAIINEEKNILKPDEVKKFKDKIEEIFKKLEIMKNDEELPGHIKYLIINLIEKKKNNYQESKFEKSLKAKSKKEVEEELKNKDNNNEKNKEKQQMEINDKIKTDLYDYKDFVEEEGSSEKYLWAITTELYDEKLKKFDGIMEGFLISSADFIEKDSNIKYAKDYIKELVGYYNEKMNKQEKHDLQKRVFNLFEIINDLSLETPKLFEIYAYVFNIMIENNLMKIEDLENIYKEEMNNIDLGTLNKIFQNIYECNNRISFKKKLQKFEFIYKNKDLFKWLFDGKN